ncbi:MAG: TraB/GumN family protein [Hyphomonadaceae bacterium]
MKSLKLAAAALAISTALLAGCQSPETADDTVDAASAEVGAITIEDARAEIAEALETAASTHGSGSPAMWRVADEDTTLYLFGTVHLLKPETEWRTEKFDTAFGESDRLITEIDTDSPEGLAAIQGLMIERGVLTDGKTLSDLLTDEQEITVSEALDSVGVPLAAVDPLQPWFASLNLSLMQIQQSGYSPTSGVETILTADAKAAGKSFGFLEDAEQQLDALAGGTLEEQIEGLVFTAETLDLGTEILGALVDEWADGDLAGLGVIIADPSTIGGDEAYDRLLVNRNANWVPQIQAMLETPGTSMIAVGAAHLAGPDSVVNMLKAEGLDVQPY